MKASQADRNRPLGQAIVAGPLLISWGEWTTVIENQPVVVAGKPKWEMSAFKGTITGDAIGGKVITCVRTGTVSGVRN